MGLTEALGSAFLQIVAFPTFLYMLIGIAIGIVIGFVPGIGGVAGMALLLPFTYTMTPASAFALLLGMHAIIQTSNTATAVLFNIPGSLGASATILDGHPMALKGEAGRALGAGYTCSILGGLIGAFMLFISVPIFRPLVLAFSFPDFFLLLLWGIIVAGTASGVSVPKIFCCAFMGIIIGLIGFDPLTGMPRYTFGTTYLLSKLPVLAIVLGVFAIPEILDLSVRKTAIAENAATNTITNVKAGVVDSFQNWFLVLRSSLMGVLIGFIPGLGAWVSSFVVYGQAAKTVKDPKFGEGDVRGVIAPESANNATEGGALIPTIMFGIPGSGALLVLLSAFLVLGLRPGAEMLTVHLDLTFVMVLTLVFSNLIGGLALLATAKKTALITTVRATVLIPIITTLCFMGAYMSNSHFGDIVVLMILGVTGYFLRHLKWSPLAFMLGYIFSREGEANLYVTLNMFGIGGFFRSPLTIALVILVFSTFAYPLFKAIRLKRKETGPAETTELNESPAANSHHINPEALFCIFCAALFIVTLFLTMRLPRLARPFPLAVAVGGLLLSIMIFVSSLRKGVSIEKIAYGFNMDEPAFLSRLGNTVGWLGGFFIGSWLLGLEYALPFVSFLFLKFGSRESWTVSVVVTAALAGLIFGIFGEILNVYWIDGKLFEWLGLI